MLISCPCPKTPWELLEQYGPCSKQNIKSTVVYIIWKVILSLKRGLVFWDSYRIFPMPPLKRQTPKSPRFLCTVQDRLYNTLLSQARFMIYRHRRRNLWELNDLFIWCHFSKYISSKKIIFSSTSCLWPIYVYFWLGLSLTTILGTKLLMQIIRSLNPVIFNVVGSWNNVYQLNMVC